MDAITTGGREDNEEKQPKVLYRLYFAFGSGELASFARNGAYRITLRLMDHQNSRRVDIHADREAPEVT
jgi:hypothetical protein